MRCISPGVKIPREKCSSWGKSSHGGIISRGKSSHSKIPANSIPEINKNRFFFGM